MRLVDMVTAARVFSLTRWARLRRRSARRGEHHDQHGQAERGHQRVDQQPKRAICGQPGGRDTGSDHHRDEQPGAGELGHQRGVWAYYALVPAALNALSAVLSPPR